MSSFLGGRRFSAIALLTLCSLLTACATAPQRPTTVRQALFGLSEQASATLLAETAWYRPTTEIVLLLAEPEVDESLAIEAERFGESLTRSLLAQPNSPQVLNWTPEMDASGLPANQWLLEASLVADGPRLRLSDRDLLPYQLTLTLRRPDTREPYQIQQFYGAFDMTAL